MPDGGLAAVGEIDFLSFRGKRGIWIFRQQEPRSLALLGMTTGWDAVRNLDDLSVNDSSALPAIAFMSG
jgi:hypothetical protein